MQPSLRIPTGEIQAYKNRYNAKALPKLAHITAAAKSQGYLTLNQLHELAQWKSGRRAELVKKNDGGFVREITEFAFKATHEYAKCGALVLLAGVQYPTASVVLHFCVNDNYPILDFRAIWSLGLQQPSAYTAAYWAEYVDVCRALAREHDITVRELDMALWQFSFEHQDPRMSVIKR